VTFVFFVVKKFIHTFFKESKMFTTPKQTPTFCLHQTFILSAILLLAGFASAYSGGTGEPNNPYQIADVNNLLQLADDTDNYDKCFILTTDLDLDPNLPGGQVFTTAVIAKCVGGNPPPMFTGIFDGAGHKIKNLTINNVDTYVQGLGLFGYVNNGNIKNIGLEDVNVTGGDFSYEIGGLVGYSVRAIISNCYSIGVVSVGVNSHWVGGLVGGNCGDINNCYSKGVVFTAGGDDYETPPYGFGGLVGGNADLGHPDLGGYIRNSWSSCDVNGGSNSSIMGGLVGLNATSNGDINNCYATGTVSGDYGSGYMGGLVGYSGGYINTCFSTGNVIGSDRSSTLGGLVGQCLGNITNCYSSGDVNGGMGSYYVGGLAGQIDSYGIISNCYSTGDVNVGIGSYDIGGLAGSVVTSDINNSYSTGDVYYGDSSYNLGGLVGCVGVSTIYHCYSAGDINSGPGSEYLGGLVGFGYSYCTIDGCYFLDISGPNNGAGTPLTDSQMKQQASFVGWDFVGETVNGTEDIWWILENITYPKLNWQRKLPPDSNNGDGGIYFPDYNFDNFVDFTDFAIFANAWLTENPFISLDGDNDVDIDDLKIFCDYWLTYTNNINF
jgi:The GLUG motif